MHCPRCGSKATLRDGALICTRTGWDMSVHVSSRLISVYEGGDPPRPPVVSSGFPGWGGNWFCPGDGDRAVEVAGVVSCPTCNRPMNQFLYELIEFHGLHPVRSSAEHHRDGLRT